MISSFFNNILTDAVSLEVNDVNALLRLVLSMVLGVIVGAERKRKGQVAGIRTFALISMGACLAMLLSIYVPQVYLGLKNGDPGRIAAQVITGVGFLGGGAMIHMRGQVKGLTTAAGIWMTATVGMAVGVGMYMCAVISTMLCIMVLTAFDWYEHRRKISQMMRVVNISVSEIISDVEPYILIFEKSGIHVSTYYISYNYDDNITNINFVVLTHTNADLIPVFAKLRELAPTRTITLSSQVDL